MHRWVFRLNNDYNNETYCYLDVEKLSVISSLRQELADLMIEKKDHVGAWFSKQAQLDIRRRILNCLRHEFVNKVVICRKDLHTSNSSSSGSGGGGGNTKISSMNHKNHSHHHGQHSEGSNSSVNTISWNQFEKFMKLYGMVIEAEPLQPLGHVYGLCFIDPHGGVEVSGMITG